MGIIYKITNTANGKVYIGQTNSSLKARWYSHVCEAKRNKQKSALYGAMRKYGIDTFTLEVVDCAADQKELNALECKWMEICEASNPAKGYNIRGGGSNGKLSETTKQKMSAARTGPKHFRYGKTLTDEHKRKLAESRKSQIVSEETRKKLSLAGMGRKVSDATRKKIGDKRRGHVMPEHVKEALRQSNLGNTNKRFPVACLSTGQVFESVEAAAKFAGLSKASISRHIAGKQSLKSGLIFSRLT